MPDTPGTGDTAINIFLGGWMILAFLRCAFVGFICGLIFVMLFAPLTGNSFNAASMVIVLVGICIWFGVTWTMMKSSK